MKKLLLFLITTVLLLNLYQANAQVGIGTDMPNPSTQLEIKSANRGIMIPQVPLTSVTDQTTITAGNLESLLVYNINTSASLTPGYYYWYQGSWNRLLTETDLPDYIVFWDVINGQFTYIDENGDIQIINIADLETLTYLGLNADGHTLEYTDEDGVVTSIDLETVIKNFETVTTIVDNGDGTFTYTDEDGNTTTIDVSNLETLTFLALNPDGKTLEYTDEDGVVTSIDLETVIKNFETVTTIVDNGDGTFTYTDEDGNTTTIDVSNLETLTFLALNPDGKTLEYTDEDGVVTSIDLETVIKNFETVTTIVDNGDGTFTYTDEDGNTTTIDVSNLETLTFLALNPDGKTLEYTDEDGVVTQIDLAQVIKNFETVTTIVDNGDGTFTYTDEDGNTTTIDVSNLETLTFLALNPDGKTLEYTDEDGVVTSIDLETVIKNFETVTTIIDNGDGTFTYTDEDGNTTTIDVSNLETLTFLALNPDGKTLEYTDEDGVVTSINLETVIKNFETVTTIVDNGDGTFTYTDEDGNTTTIDVSDLETLTFLALNPDGKTLEYTDEDGVVTSIDLETVIKNFETVTTIVDNGDGTFTYTDEDGNTTVISVGGAETLTTMVLNADGKTLEYKDENGDTTSIDLEAIIDAFETVTTVVVNADGTFTYTDEDGNTTDVDILGFLEVNNGLTKTNNTIQLGGALIKPTTITADATNTLAVAGLQSGSITDNLVVADPATGVLKQVNSAIPKFFYMPAIIFDTSVNGTFTRNLHAEYAAQFQGTGNPLLVSSTGAASSIPTLPATELEYHITYYDTTVFANLSIDANGVLTYDIIGNATEASYMTIVFVVK